MSNNLPIPTTEEAVAWAEEARSIAEVLRKLSDKFNSIDNGHCTLCSYGYRLWVRPGIEKGPCDNERCLSHQIEAILERYESVPREVLERIKRNVESVIFPDRHDRH